MSRVSRDLVVLRTKNLGRFEKGQSPGAIHKVELQEAEHVGISF